MTLDTRATLLGEALALGGVRAQVGDRPGQGLVVPLGEDEPAAGGLDHPGNLPGGGADHGSATEQGLAEHLPELLGPGLRRPRR